MTSGPIPWTAKAEYAKFYGLGPFETEQFFSILDRLDFDYLSSVKPKGGKADGGLKRPSN